MLLGFCAQARSGATCVLREGAVVELRHVPKHRITRPESSDVLADLVNLACCVKPQATLTRCAQPDAHASEERFAVEVVEVALIQKMMRGPAPTHRRL